MLRFKIVTKLSMKQTEVGDVIDLVKGDDYMPKISCIVRHVGHRSFSGLVRTEFVEAEFLEVNYIL